MSWYKPWTWGDDDAGKQRNADARSSLSDFGQSAQNNYAQNSAGLNSAVGGLQAIASGQNSVSQLQLKQNLGQALAQQQALQASADPRNQAAAARQAMINSGRLSSGLAGQQALAGLQERNAAQSQLASALLGARGQDVQGTLGGYGATIDPNADKSWAEKNAALLGAGSGLGAALIGKPGSPK